MNPKHLIINEIMPSPEGPDAQEEWIELFNPNQFKTNVSGWKIQDLEGRTKTFTLPQGTRIDSKGFLVLKRPKTKITLNNKGDGLKLVNKKGETVDEINYEKAIEGKSFSKTNGGWEWNSTPTPGAKNSLFEIHNKKELQEIEAQQLTAALSQPSLEQNIFQNFFFVLSSALGLALFSATIILVLKRRLKK